MLINWPDLIFPPINLYSMPKTTILYSERVKKGKKVYSTRAISNPFYISRKEKG